MLPLRFGQAQNSQMPQTGNSKLVTPVYNLKQASIAFSTRIQSHLTPARDVP